MNVTWLQEEVEEFPYVIMIVVTLVAAVVLPCLMGLLFGPPLPHDLRKFRRVALVIAHPDDEALFFWPALMEMKAAGASLSILCLSTGNADGLGTTRTLEMKRSAERLGISAEALTILDDAELPDGMQSDWSPEVVAARVRDFVIGQGRDVVLTFDDGGVSGHPNHVATSRGVQRALDEGGDAMSKVRVLMLESVPLSRKYFGPLHLLALGEPRTGTFTSTSNEFLESFRALAVHKSQLVWYRVLFAFFSRYAYVNTFVGYYSSSEKKKHL